MHFLEELKERWLVFWNKTAPAREALSSAWKAVDRVFTRVIKYISKFRKIFLAVPVAWGAVSLAIYNQGHLPRVVGLDLQSNGEFTIRIIRELAVLGPMAITALCLLLMFISKKTLTPWFVSLVSLLLPLVILLTNVFPR